MRRETWSSFHAPPQDRQGLVATCHSCRMHAGSMPWFSFSLRSVVVVVPLPVFLRVPGAGCTKREVRQRPL